jgi:hypothetical protein
MDVKLRQGPRGEEPTSIFGNAQPCPLGIHDELKPGYPMNLVVIMRSMLYSAGIMVRIGAKPL